MIFTQLVILLLSAQLNSITPIESISPKDVSPIAPLGGVMMVPLFVEELSGDWPVELELQLEDGSNLLHVSL